MSRVVELSFFIFNKLLNFSLAKPVSGSMKIISSLILASGITASGFFVSKGIITFKDANKLIEVRGLDERLVKANEGYLDLRFSESSDNIIELSKAMDGKTAALRTYLTEQGFGKAELREIPVTITDNSSSFQSVGTKPPPRYTARGGIVCSSSNVDRIDTALIHSSSLLAKGIALESSYAKYLFTNLNGLKPEMLKNATQNARASAETFAKDALVPLGSMRSASQGLFSITSPNSDVDDESSIMKKVRVVVKASYQLKE